MALIDFHCHIDLYDDPFWVAQEAERRGVYILSVTTTPSAFEGTQKLTAKNNRIRTALGFHPELVSSRSCELSLFQKLLPLTPYVGEVGVDGSKHHRSSLEHQCEVLMNILNMCAKAGGKTISLHSRGAVKHLLQILEAEPLAGRFVLHWFSGTDRDLAWASDLGCWFSIGPAMLNSETGRKKIRAIPLDRILPETDGPFGMTAGQPLFPWEANQIANTMSEELKIAPCELNKIFSDNFKRLTALSL